LEQAIKAKMLTFVLPAEKPLVVSFWTCIQIIILWQPRRIIERTETIKKFC